MLLILQFFDCLGVILSAEMECLEELVLLVDGQSVYVLIVESATQLE